MQMQRFKSCLFAFVGLLVAGAISSCADTVPVRAGEDPYNVVYFASLDSIVPPRVWPLRTSQLQPPRVGARRPRRARPQKEKLHPTLVKWVVDSAGTRQQLIVSYWDTLRVPVFPEPDPRMSSGADSARLDTARTLMADLKTGRTRAYVLQENELEADFDARILSRYWLIQALLVEMPIDSVLSLSGKPQIRYIQPRFGGERPPVWSGSTSNFVSDGRDAIVSDPYYAWHMPMAPISLLDTGVYSDHVLFCRLSEDDPQVCVSPIVGEFDCYDEGIATCADECAGDSDCLDECYSKPCEGLDPSDCATHGTATAAIIVGSDSKGDAYRGVTEGALTSYKVYHPETCRLDGHAALTGFQNAVLGLSKVIVAEMQGLESDHGALSYAADRAFDANVVVLAPNGDMRDGTSTVHSPALAHKAIGVGGYDLLEGDPYSFQTNGPTDDKRFKPDISAPKGAETANASSVDALAAYDGTSGALPFAAGGATLLRSWLKLYKPSIDAGQVYSQMILAGRDTALHHDGGAGFLELPTSGWCWYGKVAVRDGVELPIDLNVAWSSIDSLEAAIWWDEDVENEHSQIDLHIVSAAGDTLARSGYPHSVFQRATVAERGAPDGIASGPWKIVIVGRNVRPLFQRVYWTVAARR